MVTSIAASHGAVCDIRYNLGPTITKRIIHLFMICLPTYIRWHDQSSVSQFHVAATKYFVVEISFKLSILYQENLLNRSNYSKHFLFLFYYFIPLIIRPNNILFTVGIFAEGKINHFRVTVSRFLISYKAP